MFPDALMQTADIRKLVLVLCYYIYIKFFRLCPSSAYTHANCLGCSVFVFHKTNYNRLIIQNLRFGHSTEMEL